ncbi:universal stress protein [Corynebacterium bovis]|uniref:Universal stress protein n=1 Tax=Corynebacterium bovis TaxID=36808 RepID=A0A3R8VVU6_9CORY|nr:universal stress protein [Corynebacterium bovis]RRO91097.1 universal stress protein [Corynebacterium bovis]RRO96790.1 universal stress protein [Corynebacterium bovis]RRO98533.1 universal stress protein [Corynebacterium bovis]RRO99278.1 universal stress protein [Corynebacterium bovis]RRQ01738.1 universal stress protein [Corynebacterium bovis]
MSSEATTADPRSPRPLRILVTWRPESTGTECADYAAWLARTQPVVVRTVTVISRVWSPQPNGRTNSDFERWLTAESTACAASARDALRAAGVPASMIDPDQPSVVEIDHSETTALISAAEDFDADLMLLGSHPAAPRGRFRIGSTADALLHCAPLPLGVAPRQPKLSKRGVTRVNCSYVDTEQSHQALRHAADLAHRWGVPLRLVAFSPRGATMYPTEVSFDESSDMMVEWREQALALLDRGRDRALERHGDLHVLTETGSGYGWSGAMNALKWKKGDLLVLGSSVLGDFNRVFIGPSTNQIVRHSPAPVLISPV